MTVEPLRWGRGLFPEIRISVRTSTGAVERRLSPPVQAAALSGVVVLCCGLGYLAACRIDQQRNAAEREAAMMRVESANIELQDALAAVKDKLVEATRNLGQAQDRQYSLASQSDAIRGQLRSTDAKLNALDEVHQRLAQQKGEAQQLLNPALAQAQAQLHQLQAERATLEARLSKVESDRAQQQDQVAQYRNELEALGKKLQQLTADRDAAASERDRMRARLGELQQKLSQRAGQPQVAVVQPGAAPAIAPAAPATAAAAPSAPGNVVEARQGVVASFGRKGLDQVERVLGSAGVDVDRLFSEFGVRRGLGGPFVTPAKFAAATSGDKLDGIAGLIRSLPVSAPLAEYQLESGFGRRRDPMNHHGGFHTGVDLSAPYGTPVYATAPGVVTFTGYRGDYGKVVEIDHGNGISTVYAHLHRYVVAEGEKLAAQAQIGFVGTTGRATGPHVHYEVKVNGEPQDPEKFLALAHLIPTASR